MSEIKPGAIHQMPGGRRVQVGISPDGKVMRNWNGRVAVRNVETGRLSYVKDDDLLRATPAPVAACVWITAPRDRVAPNCKPERWFDRTWVSDFEHCPYCGKPI